MASRLCLLRSRKTTRQGPLTSFFSYWLFDGSVFYGNILQAELWTATHHEQWPRTFYSSYTQHPPGLFTFSYCTFCSMDCVFRPPDFVQYFQRTINSMFVDEGFNFVYNIEIKSWKRSQKGMPEKNKILVFNPWWKWWYYRKAKEKIDFMFIEYFW